MVLTFCQLLHLNSEFVVGALEMDSGPCRHREDIQHHRFHPTQVVTPQQEKGHQESFIHRQDFSLKQDDKVQLLTYRRREREATPTL